MPLGGGLRKCSNKMTQASTYTSSLPQIHSAFEISNVARESIACAGLVFCILYIYIYCIY